MKKVLIVTPYIMPGGGPAGYTHNLYSGLRDIESSDVCVEYTGEFSERRFKGYRDTKDVKCSPRRFSLVRGTKLWSLLVQVRDFLRTLRVAFRMLEADLCVIQGYQDAFGIRVALFLRCSFAYMPHSPSVYADEVKMNKLQSKSVLPESEHRRILEWERNLIARSRFIVFPSYGAATEYRSAFAQEIASRPAVYLASGIARTPNVVPVAYLKSGFRVLFAGRYVSHKGYDVYCEAARLCAANQDIVFYSVGGGAVGGDSNVIDLGWKDNVHSYVSAMDVVVIPNRLAYYDLLPLECAALGKPLIMTSVGGNVDQMKLLPDVISCEPNNAADLARAVLLARERMIIQPDWGGRNLSSFNHHFLDSHMARRWLAVFKKHFSDGLHSGGEVFN